MVEPAARREMVTYVVKTYAISVQRSCGLIQITRSSYYYRRHPRDDRAERAALRDVANRRRKWGYRFLMAMLIREGFFMNHKKVERLYKEEGNCISGKRKRLKNGEAKNLFQQLWLTNYGVWILYMIDW